MRRVLDFLPEMEVQERIIRSDVKPLAEKTDDEMVACYRQLQKLVPTVPENGDLPTVQLLQHVIDYILDLELTLRHELCQQPSPRSVGGAVESRSTPTKQA